MEDQQPYMIRRIHKAGEQMQTALGQVFECLPSHERRAGGLHRRFGLQKDASRFLYNAYRAKSPLIAASHLPGSVSLQAVEAKFREADRIPQRALQAFSRAIESFENAVADVAGERAELNEMLSYWIPGARREAERRASIAMHRAVRSLKGISIRRGCGTRLYVPGERTDELRIAHGIAFFGMRSFSPQTELKLGYAYHWAAEGKVLPFEEERDLDVGGYSEVQGMRVDPVPVAPTPDRSYTPMGDPGAGSPAIKDVVLAKTGVLRRGRASLEEGEVFVESALGEPFEAICSDYLIHKGIDIQFEPEAMLLDYMETGRLPRSTPRDRVPRFPFDIELQKLNIELLDRDAGEFIRYGEFVDSLARALNSKLSDFNLYRVVLEYPPYASCLRVYI